MVEFGYNPKRRNSAPRRAELRENQQRKVAAPARVRRAPRIRSPRNRFGVVWLAACLLLAGWFGFRPHSPSSATTPRTIAATQPATATVSGHASKPIEQVRVGERVLAHNPLATREDRLAPEPDERTWRPLKLRMTKVDGHRLKIELLRPIAWINRVGAVEGGSIGLDLPELGAAGSAEVLSLGACPTIECGEGEVVTATFAHEAASVIDLSITGLSEPIGCTANHPFWSEDRQAFVSAGELQVGERLRHADGGTTRVAAVSPRAAGKPVYNLEVNGQHVYYVSSAGVLVHNSYFSDHHPIPQFMGGAPDQPLLPLPTPVHVQYHQQLSGVLGQQGMPPMGGPRGSYGAWQAWMAQAGNQQAAFQAAQQAAQQMGPWGPSIIQAIQQNIQNGQFTPYP